MRVWLESYRFSPYDYYKSWVNSEDGMGETYLKQFTFLPNEEIDQLTSVQGEALRDAKQVLAFEATALAHGIAEAEKAAHASRALFSGARAMTAEDATLPTTEIPAFAAGGDELTLADAFVLAGLTKSRGEARRLASQGGLSVNDEKVTDVDVLLRSVFTGVGDAGAILLRAGKKSFRRIVVLDRS